jgi:hypothetical protein
MTAMRGIEAQRARHGEEKGPYSKVSRSLADSDTSLAAFTGFAAIAVPQPPQGARIAVARQVCKIPWARRSNELFFFFQPFLRPLWSTKRHAGYILDGPVGWWWHLIWDPEMACYLLLE